mgnify:FL=1
MKAVVTRVNSASVSIDGEVHAKMDPDRAVALLEEIRAKEGSAQ